jgi:hypothetical protein
MSDHKFEEQVRQKLSDLKLTPTPESWEIIENEIRERRRRRAPIFWLPLLLLGLGAGGYFILKPTFRNTSIAAKETVAVHPEQRSGAPTANDDKITAKSQSSQNSDEPKPSTTTSSTSINSEPQLPGTSAAEADNHVVRHRSKHLTPATKNALASHEPSITATKEPTPEKNEETHPEDNAEAKEDDVQPEEQAVVDSEPSDANKPEADEAAIASNKKDVTPIQETAKPAEQKKQDKSIRKKWSFGVTAFAGVSAINEGKFMNFSSAQVENVAAIPDFANVDPNALYNGPPPSELYAGFGFSVGAIAKRELSKRFSLSGGVNYLQLNTRTKVGYKMNNRQIVSGPLGYNAVTTYYLPTDNYVNEYKNRYHFIEVPVTLHTRLNKSQKLPVYWNLGVSTTVLLSSTALHYDRTTGVYYKDDALLNQVQAGLTTGFSFSLFNKTKRPLWLGPTARYNISPVLKKDVSASKNFMGLGLDLRWYLK